MREMNGDATLHDAKLQELAKRLGAHAAEHLDVERTARAVVAGLRERPRATAWGWIVMRPTRLKIAAMLVLALGVGIVARGAWRGPMPQGAVVVPLEDDLSGLTAEQLREAIDSLDQLPADEGAGDADWGGGGLSAAELRALLRALEG